MEESKQLVMSDIARRRRQELVEERERTSSSRYFRSVGYGLLTSVTSVPAIRLKTLLQCQPEMVYAGREAFFTGPISCLKHIKQREGPAKFFRGFIPNFMWTAPNLFIRQAIVWQFAKDGGESPNAINSFVRGLASASSSALITAVLFMPLILAQTKMMSDVKPARRAIYEFQTTFPALRRIVQFGGKRSLWTGSVPFFCSHIVFFSALFCSTAIATTAGFHTQYPGTTSVLTAIAAVYAAQPFDTIRARMQYRLHTQVTDYVPEYVGMSHCAKSIWKQEGLRGFYRGTSGALLAYSVAMFWIAMSTIRGRTNVTKDSEAEELTLLRQQQINQYRRKYGKERREETFYGFEIKE